MKKIKNWEILPYILVIFAVLIRVLSHERILPLPANFAPVAALALFGGVYLGKKYAILIPLAAEVIADIFIGFYEWPVMLTVWGSFILAGLIGLFIRKRKGLTTVFSGTLASSFLFFLTTNFAVWAAGAWYPKTLAGLGQCFAMAVPFFRNSVLGDLFFVGLFFGIYELVVYLNKQPVEAIKAA
ncbi:MAG: DUF6580 family putative transport protein [Patescibacteria group bacterium]